MLQLAAHMDRLGTETAFEVLARANALAAQGHDIINLGIGQPDFRTPDHIVEAGRRALAEGHHGYTPAAGIPELREAVATELEGRYDVRLPAGNVLIVPGGKVTVFFAVLIFGEPGVEILYPNPGFPIYESAIAFSGATPVPIPLYEESGFCFDPDEVLARITPATRLLILNSPANPTGGAVLREQIDRLVAGLADHPHVALLSDEIYSRILYDERIHTSLLQYEEIRDRLILLDGWSKTYAMTGWRLGSASGRTASCRTPSGWRSTATPAPTPPPSTPASPPWKGRRTPSGRWSRPSINAATSSSRSSMRSRASAASSPAAPSTPSPTSRAPATTPAACRRSFSPRLASPPSPAPASATWARATCASPTPPARKTSAAPWSASAPCLG